MRTNRLGRTGLLVSDALRSITARQLHVTLVLGVAWYVSTILIEWIHVLPFKDWTGPIREIANFEVGALCLLVAVAIADRAIDEGAPRRTAYVVAALAGSVAGVLMERTIMDWMWSAIFGRDPAQPSLSAPTVLERVRTPFTVAIYRVTHSLLYGGSAVFLYAQWRAARKTEERLRTAEFDRIRKSRLALESRLQAMQARVEPQFLFNTLAQVRDLYDRNAVPAAKMLDDLIAYLRAAMPHMRDTSSTIGQEIALAQAYLDIVRLRLCDRFIVDIEVPPNIEKARMPPMMLLPLIDHAIGHDFDAPRAKGAIRIGCAIENGKVTLCVVAAGYQTERDDDIPAIRERLAALYGTKASLAIRRSSPTTIQTTIAFPSEFGTTRMSLGPEAR
jgi:Histidine kinase